MHKVYAEGLHWFESAAFVQSPESENTGIVTINGSRGNLFASKISAGRAVSLPNGGKSFIFVGEAVIKEPARILRKDRL